MSDLLADSSLWMPLSVLIAGFIGSAHCAGMCGPLILSVARDRRTLIAYHFSRFLAYAIAGGAAGFLGSRLNLEMPSWLTLFALAMMTCILLITGILSLRKKPLHFRFPTVVETSLNALRIRAFSLRTKWPVSAAIGVGALSLFLPCAHLYTFLAAALATGSAIKGAVLMGAFVLGSLPMLGFGLMLVQKAIRPAARLQFAGLLLIVAGFLSLASFATAWRQSTIVKPSDDNPAKHLRCH